MLLSTLLTAASLRLILPVASGSILQVAISSSCHDTVAPSHGSLDVTYLEGRDQVRSWGVFLCRPDSLELAAGLSPSLNEDTFRRSSKTYCLRCIIARSALEALRNAL